MSNLKEMPGSGKERCNGYHLILEDGGARNDFPEGVRCSLRLEESCFSTDGLWKDVKEGRIVPSRRNSCFKRIKVR